MPLKLQFWRRPERAKTPEPEERPREFDPETFNHPARPDSLDRLRIPKPKKVKRFKPTGKVDYGTLETAFRSWHVGNYAEYPEERRKEKQKEDLDTLWKAFNVMRRLHAGQMRKDGRTKVETHPYNVALYAAQAGCSIERVAAALLHDTLEDCNVSYAQLEEQFGGRIAGIVSLLSAPKVRLSARHPWRRVILEKKGEPCLKLPLVDAAHPQYAPFGLKDSHLNEIRQFLEDDPKIRATIVEYQRKRLMPDDSPITDTHWDAIWIKQFDALHNLQTLKGLPPKKRREFISKSTDMAGFLFEKISPVILESVPKDARRLLEEVRREKGLDKEDPHDWIVHLPDTFNLTYERLMRLPRAHAEVVNRHQVLEAGTGPRQRAHVSTTKHRIFIPNVLIGEGEDAFDRFHQEFLTQLDPLSLSFSDQRYPRSRPAPSRLVVRGHSEIPPGLSAFQSYYVNLDSLPQNCQNLDYLKRALKNTLARYSKRPLIDLVDHFKTPKDSVGRAEPFINETKHNSYYLESPADNRVVSLFLPYRHFGKTRPTKEQVQALTQAVAGRRGQKIKRIAYEPQHEPIPGVPRTFHTINIEFDPKIRLSRKIQLLNAVSAQLKPMPWYDRAYRAMEWGFHAVDKNLTLGKKKGGQS